MSRLITRIVGVTAAVTALVLFTTSRAMAAVEPGLGEGSGSTPPAAPSPTPFEVFGMSWQSALALAVALVAVVGLTLSVRHQRHAGQHA